MKKLILCVVIFFSFQCPAQAPADVVQVVIAEDETQTEPEIEGEWVLMNVSAYTAGYESCGKLPDDPLYGITASGSRAREWHTVAAGPSVPFGTKIYIPEFLKTFVVEDRGEAIKDGHLDIYMESLEDANTFGRKDIYVFIIQDDG
jgi:3D (Asp-Asp-Asp) domain-containing protein